MCPLMFQAFSSCPRAFWPPPPSSFHPKAPPRLFQAPFSPRRSRFLKPRRRPRHRANRAFLTFSRTEASSPKARPLCPPRVKLPFRSCMRAPECRPPPRPPLRTPRRFRCRSQGPLQDRACFYPSSNSRALRRFSPTSDSAS